MRITPANTPRSNLMLIMFCSLLLIIGMLGSLTIDMYVPALPQIAKHFSVSSTLIKYTLTIYLIAYGTGQLFIGPMIDSFGRKKILLYTILLGLIGSLICSFAHTILQLYLGRFLQGAGYAAVGVATPAIARDVLNKKQFAQAASILSMAFGLGPVVSPIIGAYISHYFGWEMIFVTIVIYSILIISLVLFFIPETLKKEEPRQFNLFQITKSYTTILRNQIFLKNALSKSIAFTGFIVFYTVTPFMLQEHLQLTAIEYGWITLLLTSTIFFAKFINTFLLSFLEIDRIIFSSLILLAVASIFLLLFALLGQYFLFAILFPFVLFGFGAGFLFSNTTVAAFEPFPKELSGSVSGLLNGIQLLSAFVGSAIAANIPLNTLLPIAMFMLVMNIFSVMQYVMLSAKPSFDQCSDIRK